MYADRKLLSAVWAVFIFHISKIYVKNLVTLVLMEECILELNFILPYNLRCLVYVASMGKLRNAYRILISKSNGKTLPERHRRRRDDNIQICLKVLVCMYMDSIRLNLDREQQRAPLNTVTKM
jgi:hypothetical protein